MRILQLTVHFSPNIGGVETHLDDLVKGFVDKGNNVFVLTYLPLTAKAKAKIWEVKNKLKILRLPWFSGLFYKLVKNPAIEFVYLAPFLFLATPFVITYFKPEVIHTHGLIAGFVGVFWGKIFSIKTVTTTHSLYHFPKEGLYRNFSKWLFKNSSTVLTLSKQSKTEIEDLGIDSNKIQVFTYWVDLKKFNKIPNAKVKVGWKNKFVVFFVGRLVEEKGILVLLESLKSWDKQSLAGRAGKGITLAIAGVGPLEAEISHQSLTINNLLYLGKINNDELPLYYSASDIVIVPSIHDEGFGRVILESLACGTPVVAANRGAIPEAMDETVGKLIKISPQNISHEINQLYKNQAELKKMSINSLSFARQRYSIKNIEIISKAYEK